MKIKQEGKFEDKLYYRIKLETIDEVEEVLKTDELELCLPRNSSSIMVIGETKDKFIRYSFDDSLIPKDYKIGFNFLLTCCTEAIESYKNKPNFERLIRYNTKMIYEEDKNKVLDSLVLENGYWVICDSYFYSPIDTGLKALIIDYISIKDLYELNSEGLIKYFKSISINETFYGYRVWDIIDKEIDKLPEEYKDDIFLELNI